MIDHYGLSPTLYSVAFGVNAAAFIGASQFTGALGERFGLVRLVKFGVSGCGLAMLAMFAYYASGGDRLAVLIVLYFIASGCMGFVIPPTSVLALEKHGAIAGTASALLGTMQMLTGALVMAVVGLFTDGRPLPMVTGMAGGALVACILTWLTLGGRREPVCAAG
jgi:DHA1 family bicyclomycin/chloramphenicol resistance-like MFS transporter